MKMIVDAFPDIRADFIEAGTGPLVVLVHASAAGARQWRRLMEELKGEFRLRAVNLFGYGETPEWPLERHQSLDDQARLVQSVIPADARKVHIVGHSLGGAVAMKLAARLGTRAGRLVLFEPIAFDLLRQAGCANAYSEIATLCDVVKTHGWLGDWEYAAERFADYWSGEGTWRDMPAPRRAAFAAALRPVFFEWDAVMAEMTTAEEWARLLPRTTLVMTDRSTVRPIALITELLRRASPRWSYMTTDADGHMSPLTRPAAVNPHIRAFLRGNLDAAQPMEALAEC